MIEDPEVALEAFRVAHGVATSDRVPSVSIVVAAAPHAAPFMPAMTMAVYSFHTTTKVLKVGRAGSKSRARYNSQHYLPNAAGSTLARSITIHPHLIEDGFVAPDDVGAWLRQNTSRVDFIMSSHADPASLALLEAFLHLRWKPIFEGKV